MSENRWVKCISTEGTLRGVSVQAAALIQEMADQHGLKTDVAIRGLGEAVIGALILASYCKQGQKINLNIKGSGHYQQALIDAYPDGNVRGFVMERLTGQILTEQEGPWGKGLLSILRTQDQEGEKPYIGTVPLLTGYLAKDLSFYWVQSEQVPSAVGLFIDVKKGKVVSAVGFLVQSLPGVSSTQVRIIEQHIQELGSLAERFVEDANPLRLLSHIFQSTSFMVVEEKSVQFKCKCSLERVERALSLVGIEELQSILREEGSTVVKCDFCSKEYRIDEEGLNGLIQSLRT